MLYHNPHPYWMLQQQRQRHAYVHHQRQESKHAQVLGASAPYPIAIPSNNLWNAPDSSIALETFAWPSLWFDVPSISPPASGQLTAQTSDMFDTLPDLIHSDTKTPDVSPVSSRDACTTPAQDSTNVVAICDVPLVAPRPLPFTPPAFLQFDCLPDEDEDLSFPPYTHSRRHPCDVQQQQKQNPRKRPAPPPLASSEAESITSVPSISKKRRRVMHGENAAPPQPAVFIDGDEPQLVHFTCDSVIGWV